MYLDMLLDNLDLEKITFDQKQTLRNIEIGHDFKRSLYQYLKENDLLVEVKKNIIKKETACSKSKENFLGIKSEYVCKTLIQTYFDDILLWEQESFCVTRPNNSEDKDNIYNEGDIISVEYFDDRKLRENLDYDSFLVLLIMKKYNIKCSEVEYFKKNKEYLDKKNLLTEVDNKINGLQLQIKTLLESKKKLLDEIHEIEEKDNINISRKI